MPSDMNRAVRARDCRVARGSRDRVYSIETPSIRRITPTCRSSTSSSAHTRIQQHRSRRVVSLEFAKIDSRTCWHFAIFMMRRSCRVHRCVCCRRVLDAGSAGPVIRPEHDENTVEEYWRAGPDPGWFSPDGWIRAGKPSAARDRRVRTGASTKMRTCAISRYHDAKRGGEVV